MVTGFFCACHESKRTLYQLVHLAPGSFGYSDGRQLINALIVKKILSGRSTYLTKYKTRTNDWLGLEADSSPNVSFPCFAAANVHYGLFGELLERPFPPPLYDFSGPCHYGLYRQLLPGELNPSSL